MSFTILLSVTLFHTVKTIVVLNLTRKIPTRKTFQRGEMICNSEFSFRARTRSALESSLLHTCT